MRRPRQQPTSLRLTSSEHQALQALRRRLGVSLSAVVTLALRLFAEGMQDAALASVLCQWLRTYTPARGVARLPTQVYLHPAEKTLLLALAQQCRVHQRAVVVGALRFLAEGLAQPRIVARVRAWVQELDG